MAEFQKTFHKNLDKLEIRDSLTQEPILHGFAREIRLGAKRSVRCECRGNSGGNPAKETAKNGRLYWLTADQGPLRKAVQHPEDVEHIGGFRADPGSGGTDPPLPKILRCQYYKKL